MTALTRIDEAGSTPLATGSLNGILRVLTCGSVDDGKSTLIGRLLWDASDLFDDQRATLERGRRIDGGHPDYSLLVDGLVAEREQGITIDIAWRYFDTATRRFVVIDSPGHEQYTRNMASGASHADVAIMLVDARAGIKKQTRRHAAILDLVGLKRVVLAVNKMDLAGWSEPRFREIERDFKAIAARFHFDEAVAIPVSAALGDNVARPSDSMEWYCGPTLLSHLESLPSRGAEAAGPFRMPVQTVLRQGVDFRGLAGTVSSGVIHVGDPVVDPVSGRAANVKRIATFDGDLQRAAVGQAIVMQLDADIDVSRGAILAAAEGRPHPARDLSTHLVWLSDTPFDTDNGYLLRTATDLVPVSAMEITSRLDLETLAEHPASTCAANDIVLARISLGRPTALDLFRNAGETGSFMLVDPISGATVAGGVVTELAEAEPQGARKAGFFVLSRDNLEGGLCADLGWGTADQVEFRRRANEVALLLSAAGIAVELDLQS